VKLKSLYPALKEIRCTRATTDGLLATGMVTSPAWASWLGDLNQVLTTATLIVGLALGLGRLVQFLRRKQLPPA
jgi:hypothetical protein